MGPIVGLGWEEGRGSVLVDGVERRNFKNHRLCNQNTPCTLEGTLSGPNSRTAGKIKVDKGFLISSRKFGWRKLPIGVGKIAGTLLEI
jgi:hypothetical protein